MKFSIIVTNRKKYDKMKANKYSLRRSDMKLVILDGYTENPGDLSWEWLGASRIEIARF